MSMPFIRLNRKAYEMLSDQNAKHWIEAIPAGTVRDRGWIPR
ncbi:hypothetical protein [Staphylospora marina]|nr:hypothetical protein [Staphylospora marina]